MILKDLASYLEGNLIGNATLSVERLSPLNDQVKDSISFILDAKQEKTYPTRIATAFITYKKIDSIKNQIIVSSPHNALAKTIEFYLKNKRPFKDFKTSIPTSTYVHPKAEISESSYIGNNCSFQAHSFIGKHCKIGDNVVIHPNVTIYDNCIIENNVTIHSGSVIGADGFGYYKQKEEIKKIHHIGSVIIESDVEIGANSCVDRGCLGKTVIGKGSKLDNLVQIAHNCILGKNTLIASQSGLTGSIKIDNNITIGGQVGIYAHIGDNAFIAGKSGVSKPVKKNMVVSGFPAENHKEQLKKQAYLNKLYKESKQ